MSVRVCTVEWIAECPNADCRNLMRTRIETSDPIRPAYCPCCGFALEMGELYLCPWADGLGSDGLRPSPRQDLPAQKPSLRRRLQRAVESISDQMLRGVRKITVEVTETTVEVRMALQVCVVDFCGDDALDRQG